MRAQRGPAVFGRSLQDACDPKHESPPLIFTESLGLLQEGISNPDLFKQQSDSRKVQLLQKAWDQGRNPLRLAKIHDYCAVSDCLLNWMNSLPSPLLSCKLFHAFIHVHQTCSHSQWVHQLRTLFEKLEALESEVVLPLLAFLHDYSQLHRGKGFRNPSLGQIFGPALLKAHDQALPLPYPEEVRSAAALVDCLIADYDIIFRPARSPCSSPVKKPPCRAKWSPARKDLMLTDDGPSKAQEKRNQFAAKMIPLDPQPVKHLRVNVTPPETLQDENCGPVNSSSSKRRASLSELLQASDQFCINVPSVFESIPEDVSEKQGEDGEDMELDKVIGNLMCGSLSGVLFEPDDQKFLDRTSSLMTASSPTVSCHQSDISAASSDDELVQFCP